MKWNLILLLVRLISLLISFILFRLVYYEDDFHKLSKDTERPFWFKNFPYIWDYIRLRMDGKVRMTLWRLIRLECQGNYTVRERVVSYKRVYGHHTLREVSEVKRLKVSREFKGMSITEKSLWEGLTKRSWSDSLVNVRDCKRPYPENSEF